MNKNFPKTDRWAVGNAPSRTYWSDKLGWVESEGDATIYQTSYDASMKKHEIVRFYDELEVIDLDPSRTYSIAIAFNEY